ncbi:IS21 family transposase [Catellatospora sp. NPDC049609]|uniref:IS21 family transposase n=1 Tax=Catellatospora sp. NPDC049609 TaxID=3155505 RepID=UPI003447D072
MKTARQELDIINAYEETGSLRAAAALCGTTHKTVSRVLARRAAGQRPGRRRSPAPGLAEPYEDLIFDKVKSTDGRITAKRLLPIARAAGYEGSARTFRRTVAEQKARWKRLRRVYRPWAPTPGEHLLIDYGTVTKGPNAGLKIFTAVLAWSRWRFVRFTRDESLETTLRMLAECFEAAGGVPAIVLADRMGCLKGGVVANVVVPTAGYVRFAAHYGFRPDFCEAKDPESKGAVEAAVRLAKSDLVVPAEDFGGDLSVANAAAVAWCAEINAIKHSETQAIADERLTIERDVLRTLPSLRLEGRRGVARKVDKLSTVRIGSARYSVPHRLVGQHVEVATVEDRIEVWHDGDLVAAHRLVAPGETSIADEHYDRPARRPRRAVRPRTKTETAFLALGQTAEAFLRAAAAAGTTRLPGHLAEIVALEPAHGRDKLIAALARAVEFRRFTADDVRAILAAGPGAPQPTAAGQKLAAVLPLVPTRSLDAYRADTLRQVA